MINKYNRYIKENIGTEEEPDQQEIWVFGVLDMTGYWTIKFESFFLQNDAERAVVNWINERNGQQISSFDQAWDYYEYNNDGII